MLNAFFLFVNQFRDDKITPERLYNFGIVVLQSLIANNDNGQFDAAIATLTSALQTLKTQLSDIDSNVSDQKTETKAVNDLIVSFQTFMRNNEPFIAKQLGGKNTAGYQLIYPFGVAEYSKISRTNMPTLTSRVSNAAAKYEDSLGSDLYKPMEAFAPDYERAYNAQQTQINTVKQQRDQRTAIMLQSQLALNTAVHVVAAQYPGNVAKCGAFFPFTMLYPQTKKTTVTLKGTLEKNATANLLNRTLTKGVVITATNTGDNAPFAVWAAANITDAMPANAYVVNAAAAPVTILASSLGDLQKNTFIMIKNLSDVNQCAFAIGFTGLKKKIDQPVTTVEMKVVAEEEAS